MTTAQAGAPLGVAVGSNVSGFISIDLDLLPEDDHPSVSRGWYRYFSGDAGMIISLDTGSTVLNYDSVNTATGSGLARGIFVTDIVTPNGIDSEDIVSYQMQVQSDPSAVALSFRDDEAPFDLFSSAELPLSLDQSKVTKSTILWQDNAVLSSTGFEAEITSYQYEVVPEPSSFLLALLGLFTLAVFHRK